MSASNVINMFGGGVDVRVDDVAPADVLTNAIDENLGEVFVIGYGERGGLFTASSNGDAAKLLLMLELAKIEILKQIGDM